MMHRLVCTFFVVACFGSLTHAMAQTKAEQIPAARLVDRANETRVLFVGNSFTYYNNLPSIVAAFAAGAQGGRPVLTKDQTIGGATLEKLWHLRTTKSLLTEAQWDVVVLQEQSSRPIVSPERMLEAIRSFDVAIKGNGARTILYLTWARHAAPEEQKVLNEAYAKAADDIQALVAPVGPAWQIALELNPHLVLHAADGRHPSPLGSYVAACTLYLVISGSRQACPALELAGISPVDARLGREAALKALLVWPTR
jgi:hypothetical protein